MLGERIKGLRIAFNYSQVNLADKLGVTKQSISNWENGNIIPSVEMLLKIANVFSVTTDYLLGEDDRRHLDVDGLTPEQMALVQRMVKYLQLLNEQQKKK